MNSKNIKLPIYLDYQSTTPMDPRVIEAVTKTMKEDFGNPHSRTHMFGWKAAQIAKEEMLKDYNHIKKLSDKFYNEVGTIEAVYLNGDKESRYPGNLNFSFAGIEGESMIMALKDLAVSSGSACTSSSLEPSYVLHGIGVGDDLAHTSIRFGIGRFTTETEIDYAINVIKEKIGKLRSLSPIWDMMQEGIDLKSINWASH